MTEEQNNLNFENRPKKNGSTILITAIIVVLILSIVVLSVIALKNNNLNDNETSSPKTTDENKKDNDLIIREDPVALTINNVDLTKSEYIILRAGNADRILSEEVEIPEGADDDEARKIYMDYINGDDEGVSFWNRVDEETLEQAKEYAAYKGLIKEKNIELTEEEAAEFEFYLDQSFMLAFYEDVDEIFLSVYGVTKTEYYNFLFTNYKMNKLISKEAEGKSYSVEELKPVYDENKEQFQQWTVRHILISTEDSEVTPTPGSTEEPTASPSNKDDKLKLAEELLNKINNGEDMEKLVEEYSEDPGKVTNKGLYDVRKNSNYVKEFLDWAVNSKKGDTGIVETDYGYHIMKCEEDDSFESRKEDVNKFKAHKDFEKSVEEMIKGKEFEPTINKDIIDDIDMKFFLDKFVTE